MGRGAALWLAWLAAAGSACFAGEGEQSPAERAWHNPKIRSWKDYPFVDGPGGRLHSQLWQDFDDVPVWAQRGRIVYVSDQYEVEKAKAAKAAGASLVHVGPKDA